jgi:hypothetical protein
MVFSCYGSDTVRFIKKEGIELFQIGKDKTGSGTYEFNNYFCKFLNAGGYILQTGVYLIC